MKTSTAIGAVALAHFGTQLLLAQFVVVSRVVLLVINACFSFKLPVDLGLSSSFAFRIWAGLNQPVRSLPLPDWVWENWRTALGLAAVNSLLWGICLGALICRIKRRSSLRPALQSETTSGTCPRAL